MLDFFVIIFIFSFHHFMIGTARLLDESDRCSRHFIFLNLVLSEILLEGPVTLFSVLIIQ